MSGYYYTVSVIEDKSDRLTKAKQQFIIDATRQLIIEIGIEVSKFGTASLTLRCEVRNMMTRGSIITIEKIIMVNLDNHGKPKPHGKTKIEYISNRLKE